MEVGLCPTEKRQARMSYNHQMNNLDSQIESILFTAGRPVSLSELTKTLNQKKPEVKQAVEQLKQNLLQRGITLIEKDEKYQLVSSPENARTVGSFLVAEQREKLTDVAIETLAIITYKQPISRAEIEAIRGVNSQYILRQLLIRGLIEKATSEEDARRLVYKTTLDFMTHLGIKDMKDLPDFEELTKSVTLPEQEKTSEEEKKDEFSSEIPLSRRGPASFSRRRGEEGQGEVEPQQEQ